MNKNFFILNYNFIYYKIEILELIQVFQIKFISKYLQNLFKKSLSKVDKRKLCNKIWQTHR